MVDNKDINISEDDQGELYLLNIQKNADLICIIADILSYSATLESIELINSKYNNLDYTFNPDIPTLQSTILSFLTRLIYTQIGIIRFNRVYNKKMNGEFEFSLNANSNINLANIFKTIGSFYAVIASIEIYYRDITQPIFGI